MGTPYLAEIKLFPTVWAPQGWARCDGQLLPINQNQPLFSLIGTAYGGNGQTNFALPDMRGRLPVHVDGFDFPYVGTILGQEAHTITQSEMPQHTHFVTVDNTAPSSNAAFPNARLSNSAPANLYGPFSNPTAMNAGTVANTGGSQPHTNLMPYTVLTYCIALQGAFPSPN